MHCTARITEKSRGGELGKELDYRLEKADLLFGTLGMAVNPMRP